MGRYSWEGVGLHHPEMLNKRMNCMAIQTNKGFEIIQRKTKVIISLLSICIFFFFFFGLKDKQI